MLRLSRFLAIIVLAISPLLGSAPVSASPARWPRYPSLYFSSDTCNVSNNYVVCQPGGIMESQIDSSYQCNQINIEEVLYNSGPINLTLGTNDGINQQTLSIDGNGTWYVQIPGPFPLNAVTLEFNMPDGASFGLPNIYSTPCPVATETPTAAPTDTVPPASTATNTPNPSWTPTAIPTYTPLPSGHVTFTPTPAPTGTITPTPSPSYRNCGIGFFFGNCDMLGSTWTPSRAAGTYWYLYGSNGGGRNECVTIGAPNINCSDSQEVGQDFTVPSDGVVCVDIIWIDGGTVTFFIKVNGGPQFQFDTASATGGSNAPRTACSTDNFGPSVHAGDTVSLLFNGNGTDLSITDVYERTASGTPIPTNTPGPTNTGTPGPATNTPLPNPFGTASPIPSDTPCPSGCAVAALTTVPGWSTVVTVDTSPFSPLLHLSLARSTCTPFGYVQIPYPVITGTPVLGQPLQFGWTAPITHTWDDTNIITNTAIQPCAMAKEISPYVWDFTYWGSGFGLFVVFTLWLIGWIGRLSGDHTIDG